MAQHDDSAPTEQSWPPSPKQPYTVPEAVRIAARLGDLVVFIGAGVSALCQSPLWAQFANQMIDKLNLSFIETEQLKLIDDVRRRASIAVELARENSIELDFHQILHPINPGAEGLEAYRILASMNPVFVTTNYDTWLDDVQLPVVAGIEPESEAQERLIRATYCYPHEFTIDRLSERGAVIHLHGSCGRPDSMVVSLKDYAKLYNNSYVQQFLRELFEKKTVLFIGYALGEIELLERLIQFSKQPSGGSHFLLYHYRSTEITQLRFLRRFFAKECGIEVQPYCIDERGWNELVNVLSQWREQIDIRNPTFVDHQRTIDDAIRNADQKPLRDAVLRLLKRDSDLAAYFFPRAKGLLWLPELLETGFFSPDENPTPKRTPDGYIEFGQWPPLRYLEHASAEADRSRDQSAASEILKIIRDVTTYASDNGIDNPLTWRGLANAFAQLPINSIRKEDLQVVGIWLATAFDFSTVGDSPSEALLPKLLAGGDEDMEKALELFRLLTVIKIS